MCRACNVEQGSRDSFFGYFHRLVESFLTPLRRRLASREQASVLQSEGMIMAELFKGWGGHRDHDDHRDHGRDHDRDHHRRRDDDDSEDDD